MMFSALRQANDRLRATTGVHEREQILRDTMRACIDSGERIQAAMMLMGRLSLPSEGLTTGIKEAFVAKDLGLEGRQSLEDIGKVAMERGEAGKNQYEVGDIWAFFRSYLEDSGRSHEDKSRIINIALFEMAQEKQDIPFLLQILCEKVNNGIDDKIILYALAGRGKTRQTDGPIAQKQRDILGQAFAFNPNIAEWIWALDNPADPDAKALIAGQPAPGIAIEPQLCARVDDLAKVLLEHKGMTIVQPKLDGMRCHIHVWREPGRQTLRVRIFSRTLKDMTADYGEVVEAAMRLPIKQHAILDGELVALEADGGVAPFSVLQRRLGRQENREAVRVGVVLYDMLLWDAAPLGQTPYSMRQALLEKLVAGNPVLKPIKSKPCAGLELLRTALMEAFEAGEEGLVCKDPASLPEPGARNKSWIKLKPDYLKEGGFSDTYDLVVIGYQKGRGRRHGKVGALWAAIRQPGDCPDMECVHSIDGQGPCHTFLPVCKVGTGLKDTDLDWFMANLKPLPTHATDPKPALYGMDVAVETNIVIEVGATGGRTKVDTPPGFSLRFPYFIRVRDDKTPTQATSTEEVEAP